MTNGEIAHYEQFLCLPQSFQKLSAAESSKSLCMWERVNTLTIQLEFSSPFLSVCFSCRLQMNYLKPFPLPTNQQQTTVKTFRKIIFPNEIEIIE